MVQTSFLFTTRTGILFPNQNISRDTCVLIWKIAFRFFSEQSLNENAYDGI